MSRTMSMFCAVVAAALLAACGADAQENTAGLAAFRNLSLESVNLTEALYDAILDGNLAGALTLLQSFPESHRVSCVPARVGRCSRHTVISLRFCELLLDADCSVSKQTSSHCASHVTAAAQVRACDTVRHLQQVHLNENDYYHVCLHRSRVRPPLRNHPARVSQAAANPGSLLCAAAQRAYAASRPPYEQIEVLAGAFPELDSDIDARCCSSMRGDVHRSRPCKCCTFWPCRTCLRTHPLSMLLPC